MAGRGSRAATAPGSAERSESISARAGAPWRDRGRLDRERTRRHEAALADFGGRRTCDAELVAEMIAGRAGIFVRGEPRRRSIEWS